MPDRIETAAGQVQVAAHQLVGEVRKERRSRRWWVFGLLVLFLLGFANRIRVDNQRDDDLHDRLCAAWANRVEDHALLTDYLGGFVGDSANGHRFVIGLEKAYAVSDMTYAEDRDLTKENCA